MNHMDNYRMFFKLIKNHRCHKVYWLSFLFLLIVPDAVIPIQTSEATWNTFGEERQRRVPLQSPADATPTRQQSLASSVRLTKTRSCDHRKESKRVITLKKNIWLAFLNNVSRGGGVTPTPSLYFGSIVRLNKLLRTSGSLRRVAFYF